MIRFLIAVAWVFAFASASSAQTTNPSGEPPTAVPASAATARAAKTWAPAASADDHLSVTEHEITVNGKPLKYEATAGTFQMKDEQGKSKASFFFVAYRKTDGAATRPTSEEATPAPATRPITFVFNGGPGAAAVWLHLGAVGPERVDLDDQGLPPPPPHRLLPNPQTWLDVTDLVFIDPVGTGYSRPAEGQKGEEFYGVEQDIASVADFIRLYTTRYQRWLSPKFLAGESYGTTRAAGLSEYLSDRYGIDLNGIILISSVLNFQTIDFSEGNDLPYALYLPSYTAIAWYHHKLSADLQGDLQKATQESEQFATGDYLTQLAKGGALSADDRASVVKKLSRLTSLSPEFIDKSNLRIGPGAFRKQLLNDQRKIIGRFDGRITGVDPDPASQRSDYDPSLSLYLPAYQADINDYLRRTLRFSSDLPYEALTDRVQPWNFGRGGNGYLDVAGALRSAMLQNPHLKVMFNVGYFDLATPYWSQVYTINHLDLTDALKTNIELKRYMGGHMLYHPKADLERLTTNVADFIDSTLPHDTR